MASDAGIFLLIASKNYQTSWIQKDKKYATYIDSGRNNILGPSGDFISKMYIILQDDRKEELQIQSYEFDSPTILIEYKQHSPKIIIVDKLIQSYNRTIIVNRKCLIYTLQHQMEIEYFNQPNLITQSSEYNENPLDNEDRKIINAELYQYFTDERTIIERYLSSSINQYYKFIQHNFIVSGSEINIAGLLKYQQRKIANILFTPSIPTKLKLSIHGINLLLIKKRKAKLIYNIDIPKHSYLIVFHGFNLNYHLINYKPSGYLDIDRITDMILTSSASVEIKIQTSYILN